MADPIWTYTYNFAQTPEQNGFTRFIHPPDPVVTLVTGGTPANRRIEVDTSAGGDISFLTSNVPSFNSTLGMTGEITVSVDGPGAVGLEVTYLEFPVGLTIYRNRVTLERIGDVPLEAATADNNASIVWRVTHDASVLRVYRAGVLVLGPTTPVLYTAPFQRAQFWVEGGSVGIFRAMKYFIAGGVAP